MGKSVIDKAFDSLAEFLAEEAGVTSISGNMKEFITGYWCNGQCPALVLDMEQQRVAGVRKQDKPVTDEWVIDVDAGLDALQLAALNSVILGSVEGHWPTAASA